MEDIKTLCSRRLKAFENSLTAQDKIDALQVLEISRPTLDKYLNGNAPKIETATKIIQFFTGKVQQRINGLRQTNVV